MKTLQQNLTRLFFAPSASKPDPYRKHREWAKPLAAQHGIEIERLKHGGWNVWPPAHLANTAGWVDFAEGDHFCNDWEEIRHMVDQYAKDCEEQQA